MTFLLTMGAEPVWFVMLFIAAGFAFSSMLALIYRSRINKLQKQVERLNKENNNLLNP